MWWSVIRRVGISFLLGAGVGACATRPGSCSETVTVDKGTCKWVVVTGLRPYRVLQCTSGGQTFRADTTGVGEG